MDHRSADASPAAGTVAGRPFEVSPFNADDEVRAAFTFPADLRVYDSTIRKILLTPGLRPTPAAMLRVADALADAGVRHMLLNLFWWGEPAPEPLHEAVARAVLAHDAGIQTALYLSLGKDISDRGPDLDSAIKVARDLGAGQVEIAVPLPRDRARLPESVEYLDRAAQGVASAGLELAIGLHDVSRRPLDVAVTVAREAVDRGAARLALTDSYGAFAPDAMRVWGQRFRTTLGTSVPMTMHAHNDFGLGTALAIAAAQAGIHPEASVGSISYRGGFAALEELVLALEALYDVRTGIDIGRLVWLSDIVDRESGLPRHPIKAVTGSNVFVRDQPGAMVAHLLQGADPLPFSPAVVGGEVRLVWGFHRSREVLATKLRLLGLQSDGATIDAVQRAIDRRLEETRSYPYWLTEAAVDTICTEVSC